MKNLDITVNCEGGKSYSVKTVNVPQHGECYRVRVLDGWGDLSDTWLFNGALEWLETISAHRTVPVAWEASIVLLHALENA